MFCPFCGNEISEGADYCSGCGSSIKATRNKMMQNAPMQNAPMQNAPMQNAPVQNAPVSENNGKKKSNGPIVLLAVSIAVILIGVGMLVYIMLSVDDDVKVSENKNNRKKAEVTTEEHTRDKTATTEELTEAATEAETEKETEAKTEAATEAETEKATEAKTEATEEATEASSSGGIWYDMIGGGKYYVPENFSDVTKDSYALNYVQEWHNNDYDMHIKVTNTAKENIPMNIDEEYDYYTESYKDTASYNVRTDNGYAISGIMSDEIYYIKTDVVNGRYVNIDITYPSSNKGECDGILEDFVANFVYP